MLSVGANLVASAITLFISISANNSKVALWVYLPKVAFGFVGLLNAGVPHIAGHSYLVGAEISGMRNPGDPNCRFADHMGHLNASKSVCRRMAGIEAEQLACGRMAIVRIPNPQ